MVRVRVGWMKFGRGMTESWYIALYIASPSSTGLTAGGAAALLTKAEAAAGLTRVLLASCRGRVGFAGSTIK